MGVCLLNVMPSTILVKKQSDLGISSLKCISKCNIWICIYLMKNNTVTLYSVLYPDVQDNQKPIHLVDVY